MQSSQQKQIKCLQAAGHSADRLLNCAFLLKSASSDDAEKDGDGEEDPPREGGCDVHSSPTGAVLPSALCPTCKDGINQGPEFVLNCFLFLFFVVVSLLLLD